MSYTTLLIDLCIQSISIDIKGTSHVEHSKDLEEALSLMSKAKQISMTASERKKVPQKSIERRIEVAEEEFIDMDVGEYCDARDAMIKYVVKECTREMDKDTRDFFFEFSTVMFDGYYDGLLKYKIVFDFPQDGTYYSMYECQVVSSKRMNVVVESLKDDHEDSVFDGHSSPPMGIHLSKLFEVKEARRKYRGKCLTGGSRDVYIDPINLKAQYDDKPSGMEKAPLVLSTYNGVPFSWYLDMELV